MAKYHVWTYDVWGNADDGYEVSDRSQVGSVEFDPDASDDAVVDVLIEGGFLGARARGRVSVEGGDDAIYLAAESDGMPILELLRA